MSGQFTEYPVHWEASNHVSLEVGTSKLSYVFYVLEVALNSILTSINVSISRPLILSAKIVFGGWMNG